MIKTFITGISGMFLILGMALWFVPGFYWLIGFVPILVILLVRSFMGEIKRNTEKKLLSSILLLTLSSIILILVFN